MGRIASPFGYADPTAAIGQSLGRALFGDPEMAQKQAAQQAEADQRRAAAEADRAHARLYGTQADGQTAQNTASAGLPDIIASFAPQAGETQDAAFRRALPGVVARLGQAQGDKVSTPDTVSSLASFLGGDEMARRALVAQGHSPTADFAITPGRADAIATTDASAKLYQALGVAAANHASDMPIANLQASTSRRGQDVSASTSMRGQDMQADTARAVAAIGNSGRMDVEKLKISTAGGKAPKMVNKATSEMIDDHLKSALRERGMDVAQIVDTPKIMTMLRQRAITAYQQSGNPIAAAQAAASSIRLTPKSATARPVDYPDARLDRDGRWVVQREDEWFEVVQP